MAEERLRVNGSFEILIPGGWTHEKDEEAGVLLASEDGPGLLHLVSFEQEDPEVDPAEELFVFLDGQGVELEEDEVEDLELDGAELAYCEYLTEDEDETDEEAATYWLVGVAVGPGALVFCSYSCPAGAQEEERETVLAALRTLRLPAGGAAAG
jgi:hypothetical protein